MLTSTSISQSQKQGIKIITTILLSVVITFFSSEMYSQPTPFTINYDTTITKTVKTKSFYLTNPTNKVIYINSVRTVQPEFYMTSFTPFSINPYDSVLVNLNFKTKHNVTYHGFVIFENTGLKYSLVTYLTATGKYSDAIYAFTQGLWDEPLKTALRTFTTTGYVTLGYNTARDHMFATVDKYLTNDTIECVYIGRRIRAVNRTEAQNQNFNTEHTYPQSFFNSNDPMVSDLYHLYPTDNAPNNARSNYPFGKVVVIGSYNVGGSKLGQDSTGQTVFEPRDKHKGNVARSLFYFCVKYNNISPGGFMTQKQENTLRQWNNLDTVDNNEILRNTRITALQHVRNPFIDHPELIERIQSTYLTIPARTGSKITCSPYNVIYDTLKSNDTSSYFVSIMNFGYSEYNITAVTSSIPQFIVESFPTSVPVNELRYIKVKFHPTEINQTYSGNLQINGLDTNVVVTLKGFSNSQTSIGKIGSEIPGEFNLYQNYPNPFNSQTIIKFDVNENSFVTLNIYDITGKLVSGIVSGNFNPGTYSYDFNGNSLSSGIYFIRMEAETGFNNTNYLSVKPIMLIK